MFVEAISVSNLCFKFIYHKGCLALCWLYVINEILREEQCSNSNVQRKNTKEKQSKLGRPQKPEVHVKSGIIGKKHTLLTGHTCRVLFVVLNLKKEKKNLCVYINEYYIMM